MPKYEDSPAEADAAIKAANDKASHLDHVTALAQENLEFAETTLKYALESNNAEEIAEAQRERDDCASTFAGLQKDRDEAVEAAVAEGARWTF